MLLNEIEVDSNLKISFKNSLYDILTFHTKIHFTQREGFYTHNLFSVHQTSVNHQTKY
jgi:hypothetical protein